MIHGCMHTCVGVYRVRAVVVAIRRQSGHAANTVLAPVSLHSATAERYSDAASSVTRGTGTLLAASSASNCMLGGGVG